MKLERQNQLIEKGYKIVVSLTPTKDYESMRIRTWFQIDTSNVVMPVYYRHVQKLLSDKQKQLIDAFNSAKVIRFSDLVELNTKINKNLDMTDAEIMCMSVYEKIRCMESVVVR